MKVRYTPQALADLRAILEFVADRSPAGSRRIGQRIKTLIDLLPDFPQAGQQTNVERLRRLVVTPFPYVIFYQTSIDDIVMIAVRHTARKPESST